MLLLSRVAFLSFFLVFSFGESKAHYYLPLLCNDYPIVAWYSVEPEKSNKNEYKKLKKAGFNWSLSYFRNYDELNSGMQDAEACGIKMIAHCPEISNASEATIRQLKNKSSLGMYYLKDEPSVKDFSRIAETSMRILKVDSTHQLYVNLLPIYANSKQLNADTYSEYLNSYINVVHPTLISFDNYPFIEDTFRSDYYLNLEIIASQCKKHTIPFWGFVRTAKGGKYQMIDEGRIRLQAFSNIAYGAQGIQYFTYTVPKGCESSILDTSYKPTALYDIVKGVNYEIQRLSKYLLGSSVLGVWHFDSIKAEDISLDIEMNINSKGKFIFSLIGKEESRFLMIVNKDFGNTQYLDIYFPNEVCQINKKGRMKKARKSFSAYIAPGDYILLKLN